MDKKQLEEIKKCILSKDYITDEMYIGYIISEVINRDLIEYIKKLNLMIIKCVHLIIKKN